MIVQNQLDAYNARNLSQFSQCFNDQVQVYRHPDQTLLFANKKDMLAFYESSRFNQPRLHARLVNRIVMGNKVFDHELISGLEQQDKDNFKRILQNFKSQELLKQEESLMSLWEI